MFDWESTWDEWEGEENDGRPFLFCILPKVVQKMREIISGDGTGLIHPDTSSGLCPTIPVPFWVMVCVRGQVAPGLAQSQVTGSDSSPGMGVGWIQVGFSYLSVKTINLTI